MSRTLGALILVAGFVWIPSAKAGGTNVKCAMNEDRVWVYESVVDFNLSAKLKCGEPVQIIGRVKGYVKVQTQSGVEGYVADSAIPKSALPPEPEEKPNDVGSASVAALAHHAPPPSVDAPRTTAAVASTAPVKSNSSSFVASAAAPTNSAMAPSVASNVSASPAPVVVKPQPPAVAPVVAPAPKPQPAMVASAAPAPAPAPAPVAAPVAQPSQPAEVEITLSTAPTPVPTSSRAAPAPTAAPVADVPARPAPAPVAMNSQPAAEPLAAAYSSGSTAPVASDRAPSAAQPVIQPVSDSVSRPAVPAVNPDEEEDTAVRALENENAGCTHFFSAYGLSPNQYKWLAQNRKKAFPSVCPAPNPSMVDFVVIFTHDVAFYNVTMPTAVHVDHNGFSDWTPMSTVDNSLMTQSEANSSHHEYVWVFHTTRGAFDPAKFSARRKPLFSKGETNMLGSHGGYKTVMEALTYIEEAPTAR
jgi:hypothetical protein